MGTEHGRLWIKNTGGLWRLINPFFEIALRVE
jgi:hypothetical protein